MILSYTVGSTTVLEYLTHGTRRVLRHLSEPSTSDSRDTDLDMSVMELTDDAQLEVEAGIATVRQKNKTMMIAAPGFQQDAEFSLRDNRLVMTFKKGSAPLKGSVWFSDSELDSGVLSDIDEQLKNLETNLEVYTHGGPAQYTTAIEVPARKWFESEAWTVDELVRPEVTHGERERESLAWIFTRTGNLWLHARGTVMSGRWKASTH